MAFTNVWDNTQPPDTQAANLGAQDFRSLKTDIQERFAQGFSGPAASKPALEAVFGAGTTGVIYFETDTGQLKRWNGTTWVLIGVNHTYKDVTATVVTNPAVPTDINTITIPANILQQGMRILVTASVFLNSLGSPSVNLDIVVGGTITGLNVTVANKLKTWRFITEAGQTVTPGTYQLIGLMEIFDLGGAGLVTDINSYAIDPTLPLIIKTQVEAATCQVTGRGVFVTLLY